MSPSEHGGTAVPIREKFLHSEDPELRRSGFAGWDRIRNETPVFLSGHNGPGQSQSLWYLLGYEDVYTILRDTGLFSSKGFTHPDYESDYVMIPSELDPPEHTRYRTLLNPFFSPARIAQLEPTVREVCREIIDGLVDAGSCDVVKDLALQFPTTVFLRQLGLPVDERETFIRWVHQSQHTSRADDPDGTIRDRADREIHEYMADLVRERRKYPTEDLVSNLLACRLDGRPMEERMLSGMLYLLFLAGLDTVSSMLGFTFMHLANHDEDRRRLSADPTLAPAAVEEMLRYYSIVSIARHVTADAAVSGCPMKQGDRVVVPLATADRDPSAFPSADQFVIDRKPNRHIAFGVGPHRCVGSHLARLELRVAMEEWHRRIPEYTIPPATDLGLRVGLFVTSLERLPLQWETAALSR